MLTLVNKLFGGLIMTKKIAFYDTKPYDHMWFDVFSKDLEMPIKYLEGRLNQDTAILARGCDTVCVFVNDEVDENTIMILQDIGVKLIALRCAGFNNVDLKAAEKYGMPIVRVPAYSPSSVAEHAAALLLSLSRKTHRAYTRTRDNNFSINGLMGFELAGKTVGVIGTGRIGKLFASIMKGFQLNVLAYDAFPDLPSDLEYVSLEELFQKSDIISLHCPLTPETHHMINNQSINHMRSNVVIINTSRGGLIDTEALLNALITKQVAGAGLDVYEEEEGYFFEDLSNDILDDEHLARLLSLPNVLVTSHQAFFTEEATREIARVTMENIQIYRKDGRLDNEVV